MSKLSERLGLFKEPSSAAGLGVIVLAVSQLLGIDNPEQVAQNVTDVAPAVVDAAVGGATAAVSHGPWIGLAVLALGLLSVFMPEADKPSESDDNAPKKKS